MLTVIFATHNGKDTLPRMLDSFTRLRPPQDGWKLLAVNNGSTDNTLEILEGFVGKLPLSIINHDIRGKNHALNSAIEHVDGDMIVFTDDDVIVDQDLLANYEIATNRIQDFHVFGGKILPIFPYSIPAWFPEDLPFHSIFGYTRENQSEGPVNPMRILGANMCVRKSVFDAGHRFDVNIGPNMGQYIMGSETEFTVRLSKLGYKSWHASTCLVHHIVRDYQFDPCWIIKRANRAGRGRFWMDHGASLRESDDSYFVAPFRLFRPPRWVFRTFAQNGIVAMWAHLRGDRRLWLKARWYAAYWGGYISEGRKSGRVRA